MAKALVLMFVCVALLQVATALKCYNCDKDQCKEDMKTWTTVECGKSADPTQEAVCLKTSYKDAGGNKVVSRKCALAPQKSTEITCPVIDGAKDVKCPICKADLCNSANSISLSLTAFAGIIVAAILGQKYLL
ncbi:unnamed protein product [Phaedon cochleariae]|uniref:Protein quiver n=1 Tax=Phaedon cochleariae TaxID=80249 RepID=A0A9P0D8L1_PHACE|nr:unnamed protein product [Phaedon cochleariae]